MRRTKIATTLFITAILVLAIISCAEPQHEHSSAEPQHEHSFGEPVESGNTVTYICTECGYKKKHTHTGEQSWECDDEYHWHKATCEHTNAKVDMEEHAWEEMTIEPTCMQAGELIKNCLVCQKTMKEEIPAPGHQLEERYRIDGNGRKCRMCTVCGVYVDAETGAEI